MDGVWLFGCGRPWQRIPTVRQQVRPEGPQTLRAGGRIEAWGDQLRGNIELRSRWHVCDLQGPGPATLIQGWGLVKPNVDPFEFSDRDARAGNRRKKLVPLLLNGSHGRIVQ